MQVIPSTARQVYDAGYNRFDPSQIYQVDAGIYFGTAYLEMLSKWGGVSRDRTWITRAYHGGPGGEFNGNWGPENRKYIRAITAHHKRFQKRSTGV
ncbi:MAG: hypothetical protein MK098_12935 [Marinovum sp.]|nr:hypothetical protein [Marinovum sp.]